MTLPPQFTGEPARTGTRLAAFSIDAAIVLVVAVVTALLTGSPAFGMLLAGEAVLALWILQSRAGVSPGKALLRLRVSRIDAPFSPGAGRSFVRGSLVAIGGLVFAAGAWVVEASGAWDRSGARRSWADRAAQTVVVAAPARPSARERAGGPGPGPARLAVPEPTVVARPWTPAAVASTGSRGPVAPRGAARIHEPLAPPAPPAPPAAPVWGAQQPAPETTDAASAPVPDDATGALLLIFDTGQREHLSLRHAAVLGRNPAPVEDTDVLIGVEDPDASVSKDHLRVEYDRGGLWVTDLGSTNGTELVDDDGSTRAVEPGRRTGVDDDVRVRIGNRTFTVSRLMGATS
ncbi:MAG: RDD family protein [Microbacterium sp.]|uniref:RDD family protein n=1 Tax=Microbacterium sp. TaxID=51671 RepID=UPI002612D662|nr:RDD family protein [Microbacterium sp.]MCX6502519.1 RDD family protein [Microbacterium sp.]